MLGCPSCGAGYEAGARFCSSCGVGLPVGSSGPPTVRKTVTVVFTDVAGFTALTERIDAERLTRVMTRYFEEMRSVVERHGGVVEKFIGDAIMAVFGIPRLHEDDALRAVRAAVEMHGELIRLNDHLEREWGVTIEVRTGINTGEVAAGPAGKSDTLVLGDAVNVAARLQQAGDPQEILLGAATYRLVEGAVEVEPLVAMTLKGKGEPVPAFRLLKLRPDPSARVRRLDTPMVGRDGEHARLEHVLGRVEAERSCHIVMIMGSAGLGKTRLVTEFVRSVEDRVDVVQGHCPSYGEGITFWPVVEVIRQVAGIEADHSSAEAQTRLEALLEGDDDRDAVVEQLGQLLGLGQATVGSEEIFWAVRKLLEKVAGKNLLLVVFEDLHWAQPTFLDFIEYIRDWSRDAPIMVCCTARPEFSEEHPGWDEGRANTSRVQLEPLSTEHSVSLIGNLLHGGVLEQRGRARILEATQGNPLYLEEMLSMFIDEGLLRPEDGRWVSATDLHDIPLPLTLQALLVTRLDRLEPGERQVIEVAAVMGAIFPRRALFELIVDHPEAEIRNLLRRLVNKELIRAETSGVWEDALGFHHALIREAANNCMSKEARAVAHERFADWLDRPQTQARVGEYDEVLGYHLEHAYLLRRELRPLDDHGRTIARRGGERLAAAGRKAFGRGDVVAAVNLLTRAANLLPAGDPLRVSLLPRLSESLMVRGEVQQASATLDEASELADEQDDRAVQADVVLVRTVQRLFTQPKGWADAAREEVQGVIPVLEELADQNGLARSWRLLGLIDFVQGQCASAEEALDRSCMYAHLADDRREELEGLAWLPLALFTGPVPAHEGIRRCQETIARAEGDLKVEASALLVRGGLECMRRDPETARRLLATARSIFEDLGLRFWIAGPVAYLIGWVELLSGDAEAAERELRGGYEALRHLGDRSWLSSTVAGNLVHCLYAQGRYHEAEELSRATEETLGSEDVFSQVVAGGARAKVLCALGDVDRAEVVGQRALRLIAGTDCLQLHGEALMDLAEVHRRRGRGGDAAELMKSAIALFDRKGNTLAVDNARAEIARLSS